MASVFFGGLHVLIHDEPVALYVHSIAQSEVLLRIGVQT